MDVISVETAGPAKINNSKTCNNKKLKHLN